MNIRSIEPIKFKESTILKVITDDDVIGWGESAEPFNDSVKRAIGQPAYQYGLYRHPALNMALLDIVGQTAKAPVYQVLGGPTRTKVRVMTAWSDAAAKAGYKAFMTPPPFTPKNGFDFVIDGEGKLTPGQASSLAASLERLHPLWLDEPCSQTNLGAARKVAEENVTPLGWGRHFTDLAEVQNMLREQMIDVVRLDIAKHSLTSIRKAAALAETYYVAVAPFHRGGPIATAAALQLAASIPNFFIQQIPWADGDQRKIRAEIIGGDIEKVNDGYVELPKGPGLGIKVNEQALRRYAA